jgi:translation initiation factor 4E
MNTLDQKTDNKENTNPNPIKKQPLTKSKTLTIHKLDTDWVFWYTTRRENQDTIPYNERLQRVCTFSTLEDFFHHWVYLKPASDVDRFTDLALFKKGHKPLWEECPNGGVWFFRMKKNDDSLEKDSRWEKLVFAMIGEQFDEPNSLGAVLSVRARETIIELWFTYNKDDTLKGQIVKSLALILDLDQSTFFFKDNAISLQVTLIVI